MPIQVGNEKIKLQSDGTFEIGNKRYKFNVVDFQNYNELKKIGDNLYLGQNPINNKNITIKQNSLEKSNVNVIDEMVNMLTVMRTFESNQKIIQSIDETLGKTVNEVGTVR